MAAQGPCLKLLRVQMATEAADAPYSCTFLHYTASPVQLRILKTVGKRIYTIVFGVLFVA
jgi:hypothetical protein